MAESVHQRSAEHIGQLLPMNRAHPLQKKKGRGPLLIQRPSPHFVFQGHSKVKSYDATNTYSGMKTAQNLLRSKAGKRSVSEGEGKSFSVAFKYEIWRRPLKFRFYCTTLEGKLKWFYENRVLRCKLD